MNLIPLLTWWYGGAWVWFVGPALILAALIKVYAWYTSGTRKRLRLVKYAINKSFAGKTPGAGSTIRGMEVNGVTIPDFTVTKRGKIVLL